MHKHKINDQNNHKDSMNYCPSKPFSHKKSPDSNLWCPKNRTWCSHGTHHTKTETNLISAFPVSSFSWKDSSWRASSNCNIYHMLVALTTKTLILCVLKLSHAVFFLIWFWSIEWNKWRGLEIRFQIIICDQISIQ